MAWGTAMPGARAEWMRRAAVVVVLGLAAAHAEASATLVDIAWDARGRFRHSAPLPAGQVLEVCGRLQAGVVVAWRHDTSVPVAFNIHYHVGQDVVYPVQVASTRGGADRLRVTQEQDYCWMWTNKTGGAATVTLELQR